jgi:hypothetical protein
MEVPQGQTVFFNQEYIIKHVFSPLIEIHHLEVELRNYYGNFYSTTGEWSFLLKIDYLR